MEPVYIKEEGTSMVNTILIIIVIALLVGFAFWWMRKPATNDNGSLNVDLNLPGSSGSSGTSGGAAGGTDGY